MRHVIACLVASVLGLALLTTSWAGGSHYAVDPGTRPRPEGKISEWAVPTPNFARDPAPGPDGNIYVAVMFGDKIARVDTKTLWVTLYGNGKLIRVDPVAEKVAKEYALPAGGTAVRTR